MSREHDLEELSFDVARAFQESQAEMPKDPDALVPLEPWRAHGIEPVVPHVAGAPKQLPADAVRVAMLRAAGVEDTVALGEALGMSPAKVIALEIEPGFGEALKRLRMAAGLGNWKSHIVNTIATGMLPSGIPAPAPLQGQMMMEMFEREEPKKVVDVGGTAGMTIVLTGDAMARVMGGIQESKAQVIDVTPRSTVPAVDPVMEEQRKIYESK